MAGLVEPAREETEHGVRAIGHKSLNLGAERLDERLDHIVGDTEGGEGVLGGERRAWGDDAGGGGRGRAAGGRGAGAGSLAIAAGVGTVA